MSAIFGIIRFDGAEVSARDLERMGNMLAHRAPDGRKSVVDGPVGLGHCLMRVNTEDRFEAQPLYDRQTDVTLVADLRLDNREDLAAFFGIAPADLRDMPDSALVMRAYKEWGEACGEHLLGDFAFAIWDGRAKKLVLCRDHMGQRYVFFHQSPGFLAFSTEIKGLWALADVPRVLMDRMLAPPASRRALKDNERISFEGIRRVPGGCVATIGLDGSLRMRRYWEAQADRAQEGRDEAYYVQAYRRVLSEAVTCRLRRTMRAGGLFFSGGFDSGAIAALAGPVVAAQGRKLVAAASVAPQDRHDVPRNPRRWVEIFERHMPHLDVRYVTRDGRDIFSKMEEGFRATEHAHSPSRHVNELMVEALASAGACVMMDGYGGDQTLNPRGYPWLVNLLLGGRFREFSSEFRAYRRHTGQSAWQTVRGQLLQYFVPPALREFRMRRRNGLALFGVTAPLARTFISDWNVELPGRSLPAVSARGRLENTRLALRRLQDSSAPASALLAAAHGLEFTQPFHDKRVVELALAIPPAFHVRNGRERNLARQALADLFPPQMQERGRANDQIGSDFLTMAKGVEPRILAEIDRMEREGKLSHLFDFPKMRRMLTRRSPNRKGFSNEEPVRQAMLAFIQARYREWFMRGNR